MVLVSPTSAWLARATLRSQNLTETTPTVALTGVWGGGGLQRAK